MSAVAFPASAVTTKRDRFSARLDAELGTLANPLLDSASRTEDCPRGVALALPNMRTTLYQPKAAAPVVVRIPFNGYRRLGTEYMLAAPYRARRA